MMKLWEILKRIDEDPDEMIGKQFKYLGPLTSNTENDGLMIGDIVQVVQYYELVGLGHVKFSRIRCDFYGSETFEEVEEKAESERVILTTEQAISMLPDKEDIHTFRQGPFPIGADWRREEILKAIDQYEFEMTGSQAQAMGHGMAFQDDKGWVFVETIDVH